MMRQSFFLALALVFASTGFAFAACPNTPSSTFWLAQGATDGSGNGCVVTAPRPLTIVPLDAVVTGSPGAVTALNPGHATAGGFLSTANAAGICVDQHTTAGTVTGAPSTTTCVEQYQAFYLVPGTGAVSVNSPGSAVSFGGEGLQ